MGEGIQKIFDDAAMLQSKKKWQQAILLLDKIFLEEGASKTLVQTAKLEKSVCLHALKKWQEAIDNFGDFDAGEGSEIKPKYYWVRGDCRKSLSDVEGAKNDFYAALWKAPLNEKYFRAYAGVMSNDEAAFFRGLRQIVDVKPSKSIKISAFLARKAMDQDKAAGLVQLLEASSNYINDFDALYSMADCFVYAKEYKASFAIMNRIMSLPNEGPPLPASWSYKYSDISYEVSGEYKYPNVKNYYNFRHIKKDGASDTLVVIFSSVENRFIIRGYEFYADVLHVSEKQMNFYIYNFPGLCEYIKNIIIANGYKKVKLLGSSKGSFAAINTGIEISSSVKDVNFGVAAFSPQTQLFPFNDNINKLPSYVDLLKRCSSYGVLDYSLKKYGFLFDKNKKIRENLSIHITYGATHSRDAIEALRMSSMNRVFFHPVEDFPLHATVALYIKKGESLLAALKNVLATGGGDDAFFATEERNENFDFDKYINEEYYQKMDLNLFLKSI